MSSNHQLDESVHDSIKLFCEAGDRLAEAEHYEEAIVQYNNTWLLVPDPKNNWEASTWILAAIADAYFLSGFKISARETLEYAMTCPGALGNPFLHLRLGYVRKQMSQTPHRAGE